VRIRGFQACDSVLLMLPKVIPTLSTDRHSGINNYK
jgi:hypothetical protein